MGVRCLTVWVLGLTLTVGTAAVQGADPRDPFPGLTTAPSPLHPPEHTDAGVPRTPIQRTNSAGPGATPARTNSSPWGTLVILGGIVVGIALVGRWLKRAAPQRFGGTSSQAIDLLGSRAVTPQAAIHVVRVGERLLILGSGGDGLRTLAEVTDPAEASHLMHLCRAESDGRALGWGAIEQWLPWRRAASASTQGASASVERVQPLAIRSAQRVASLLLVTLLGTTPLAAQTGQSLPGSVRNPTAVPPASPYYVDPSQPVQPLPNWGGSPPSELLPTWSGAPPVMLTQVGERPVDKSAWGLEIGRLLGVTAGQPPVAPTSSVPTQIQQTAYFAASGPESAAAAPESPRLSEGLLQAAAPQGLAGTLRLGMLVGVMSLAPAILLMTTCYVRFIVVFGLLRQAIGVQQFPPTQVLTALSLFLTGLVMWPTWSQCWQDGIAPYSNAGQSPSTEQFAQALTRTAAPLRVFMSRQIEATGNTAAIDLLASYQASTTGSEALPPAYYEDVPWQVLLPAYVLSELKTAFLIGFQIYLPFVVIDLVVSSVLASLGLGMLPPGAVALPFKLLLFVLIDGWFLTVELLLRGVGS